MKPIQYLLKSHQYRSPSICANIAVLYGFSFFRGCFYSLLYRGRLSFPLLCSKGVIISGSRIRIGSYTLINRSASLIAPGSSSITLGKNCRIGAYCILETNKSLLAGSDSKIIIKDNVAIGEFSYIGGASQVTINEGTILGQYVSIHPQNHHINNNKNFPVDIRFLGTTEIGITIGKGCWVGSKASILDGCTVGDYSVVGAGSVVTKSIGSFELWAGNPARKIRNLA